MFEIIATGRLVRDASLAFTSNEAPVLGFSVATDVGYKDSKHAVYLKCSLWGKRAESLDPYLKKGVPVTVIGHGDLRTWEKGEKHGAEITVNLTDIVLQGSRPGESEDKPAPPKQSGFRDKPPPKLGGDVDPNTGFDDDDIPF